MSFTLQTEEYEALIALARVGATSPTQQRVLDNFLKGIEKNNNITRYALWIQWQEMDQPLPPTTNFPEVWPPQMRFYLELVSRPIASSDVQAVLNKQAKKPTNVLVTKDPGALVGWTPLASYPFLLAMTSKHGDNDMVTLEVETRLGDKYVFPSISLRNVELVIQRDVMSKLDRCTFMNVSQAIFQVPTRIIKNIYVNGELKWTCPA